MGAHGIGSLEMDEKDLIVEWLDNEKEFLKELGLVKNWIPTDLGNIPCLRNANQMPVMAFHFFQKMSVTVTVSRGEDNKLITGARINLWEDDSFTQLKEIIIKLKGIYDARSQD